MASGVQHDIEQLNALIEVTLDSAHGYMDAAEEASNSRFSTFFRERGSQRSEIAERLQARVKSLGGDPERSGTTLGATHRFFASLKLKIAGSEASIIAEVEAGEDHVKEVYQEVVEDEELSDPVRIAVESEFAQIQASHDQMSALKESLS
jgi:uncharacterized protein (TIGR02284 family)